MPSLRLAAPLLPFIVALSAVAQTPPVTRAPTAVAPAPAPVTPPSPMAHATAPIQRAKLPDLVFASIKVNNVNHVVGDTAQTLLVAHVFPPPSAGQRSQQANPCNHSFTFPVVLVIKNAGSADFVPLGSAQAVGLDIGPFNSAKDLIKLTPSATQTMSFTVTLPPGNYTFDGFIDLHGQVAESNTANDKLSWPLKVTCTIRSPIEMAPAPIKKP